MPFITARREILIPFITHFLLFVMALCRGQETMDAPRLPSQYAV
jgi:hypothetical protein